MPLSQLLPPAKNLLQLELILTADIVANSLNPDNMATPPHQPTLPSPCQDWQGLNCFVSSSARIAPFRIPSHVVASVTLSALMLRRTLPFQEPIHLYMREPMIHKNCSEEAIKDSLVALR